MNLKLFSNHNIIKETDNEQNDLDFPVVIIPARLGLKD